MNATLQYSVGTAKHPASERGSPAWCMAKMDVPWVRVHWAHAQAHAHAPWATPSEVQQQQQQRTVDQDQNPGRCSCSCSHAPSLASTKTSSLLVGAIYDVACCTVHSAQLDSRSLQFAVCLLLLFAVCCLLLGCWLVRCSRFAALLW